MQLRRKGLDTAPLLDLARRLRALTDKFGARLILNDRVDIGLAVGADGIHLPGNGLSPAAARNLIGQRRLLGRSVHSMEEIEDLRSCDLDYMQLGPIFATPSKAAFGAPLGLDTLREITTAVSIPVVAVGGVDVSRMPEIVEAGAAGVAVIRAVLDALEPELTAAQLIEGLKG